jgi:uncharacterized SAM-binding protein YcdF (DUF218 family)
MPIPLRARLWKTAVRTLAIVGLLFLLITFSPFVSWYANRLSRPWGNERGDVLVVLSASGPNNGVMDPSTYWRCFMALLFYRQHPYRRIIVSGVDSAAGMRDFFVFNGVPADRILLENRARNTHENAQFTAPLLSGTNGGVVLLTSESHMFRAQKCFEKAGIRVSAVPIPDVLKRAANYSERLPLFVGEVRETASIVYYWYRGWI